MKKDESEWNESGGITTGCSGRRSAAAEPER